MRVLWNHAFIQLGNALPRYHVFDRARPCFYRLAGLHIGKGAIVVGPLSLRADTTHRVFIGERTYVNSETRFGVEGDPIVIGKDCLIGPRVSFETGSHATSLTNNSRSSFTKPITVQDRVWIGAGVIVLAGVTIHEGAVIAAAAVVNRDVDAEVLFGGVPGEKIRDLRPT